MKQTLSFVVSIYVIGLFMLLSVFLALEPLHRKNPDKVQWDATSIVVTIIPLILGGGSFYLFSKRNLAPSHLKLRKIVGAVIVVVYTTVVAYAIIYPYQWGPENEEQFSKYADYSKALTLTVLPGTLTAAAGFLFPRKESESESESES